MEVLHLITKDHLLVRPAYIGSKDYMLTGCGLYGTYMEFTQRNIWYMCSVDDLLAEEAFEVCPVCLLASNLSPENYCQNVQELYRLQDLSWKDGPNAPV